MDQATLVLLELVKGWRIPRRELALFLILKAGVAAKRACSCLLVMIF